MSLCAFACASVDTYILHTYIQDMHYYGTCKGKLGHKAQARTQARSRYTTRNSGRNSRDWTVSDWTASDWTARDKPVTATSDIFVCAKEFLFIVAPKEREKGIHFTLWPESNVLLLAVVLAIAVSLRQVQPTTASHRLELWIYWPATVCVCVGI